MKNDWQKKQNAGSGKAVLISPLIGAPLIRAKTGRWNQAKSFAGPLHLRVRNAHNAAELINILISIAVKVYKRRYVKS